jgi:DNA polymerase-3 subunit epsilon
MRNLTAIDFEAASGYRNSICHVGMVQVEDGIGTNTINLLVQSPKNYYCSNFTDIHGITPAMTKNEPTFDQIWHLVNHL